MSDRKFPGQTGDRNAEPIPLKSGRSPRERAKSHRAAAEHHGKNDHMKGNEHAVEAQKHSKVAGAASDEAHAKSSSKK